MSSRYTLDGMMDGMRTPADDSGHVPGMFVMGYVASIGSIVIDCVEV